MATPSSQYENRIMLKEKVSSSASSASGRTQNLQDSAVNSSSASQAQPSTPYNVADDPEYEFDGREKTVVFFATPEVQESGTTIWVDLSEIRAPASYSYYMGSPSRTFNINAKFVSRTTAEAERTLKYVNLLRSWRMPNQDGGVDEGFSAAEPSTLHLFGYGHVFRGIPVAIKSLNIDLNGETDYIKSKNGSDVPIIWPVSIGLQEMHSIEDFARFDISRFRKGELPWW